MAELLVVKQDDKGRWRAEPIHKCWENSGFAQNKEPSPWITLRVAKRVCSSQDREAMKGTGED